MPPPQIFSLDGHAYGLTVSGVQVIKKVPTDLFPLRWQMPSEDSNGGMSFTVMDQGETPLQAGAVVRLTDNVNNELLSSGVLVSRAFARHGGPWRRVDCDVAGWGWFLDHRVVTEFVWADSLSADSDIPMIDLVSGWGGPLQPRAESGLNLAATTGGTASRTTLRSAMQSVESSLGIADPFHLYVNDAAQVRWWWGLSGYDSALGTAATTIGDQGTYIPESLAYEVGSESRANLIAGYGTAANFLGWTWNGAWSADTAATSWDAGQPSKAYEGNLLMEGATYFQYLAFTYDGDVTSVSFTTTEYGGWQPHQALVIDDSMLTGGTAVSIPISGVSGTIDSRNVIEWQVTAGAVVRSIVQTVVGK